MPTHRAMLAAVLSVLGLAVGAFGLLMLMHQSSPSACRAGDGGVCALSPPILQHPSLFLLGALAFAIAAAGVLIDGRRGRA